MVAELKSHPRLQAVFFLHHFLYRLINQIVPHQDLLGQWAVRGSGPVSGVDALCTNDPGRRVTAAWLVSIREGAVGDPTVKNVMLSGCVF